MKLRWLSVQDYWKYRNMEMEITKTMSLLANWTVNNQKKTSEYHGIKDCWNSWSIYMLFFFYLVMNNPLCVLALLATGWIFIFRELLHRRSKELIKLSVFLWYSVNLILIVRVAIIFFSAAFLTAIAWSASQRSNLSSILHATFDHFILFLG